MAIPLTRLTPWVAARERPSPNHNARSASRIEGVVLHHTGGTDEGAESWMANPASKVSCHLHFRRDGSTTRMVDDRLRAWHAGRGEWRGHTDVNSITLGWEIGNFGDGREPYTDLQYAELAHVAAHYVRAGLSLEAPKPGIPAAGDFVAHDTTGDNIVGGGRKADPLGFDWGRFYEETSARLQQRPLAPVLAAPHKVYSEWFGENLIVMRVVSDAEWYFVPESQAHAVIGPIARATTPLSLMPPARG